MARRYAAIAVERGFLSNASGRRVLDGGDVRLSSAAARRCSTHFYRLSPGAYGALFGACAAGFIVASQISPLLLPRFGAARVVRWAVRTFLVATVVLVALAFWGPAFGTPAPWWAMAAPVLVSLSTMGFVLPNAVVGALARHPDHAGSASALMGTMQFCLGALSGVAVGLLADGTARPMALLMLLGACCANLAEAARPPLLRLPASVGQGLRRAA